MVHLHYVEFLNQQEETEKTESELDQAGRIPKGFHPSAQGCESASYPGLDPEAGNNPEGVASCGDKYGRNPVGVETYFSFVSQGSASGAT